MSKIREFTTQIAEAAGKLSYLKEGIEAQDVDAELFRWVCEQYADQYGIIPKTWRGYLDILEEREPEEEA